MVWGSISTARSIGVEVLKYGPEKQDNWFRIPVNVNQPTNIPDFVEMEHKDENDMDYGKVKDVMLFLFPPFDYVNLWKKYNPAPT